MWLEWGDAGYRVTLIKINYQCNLLILHLKLVSSFEMRQTHKTEIQQNSWGIRCTKNHSTLQWTSTFAVGVCVPVPVSVHLYVILSLSQFTWEIRNFKLAVRVILRLLICRAVWHFMCFFFFSFKSEDLFNSCKVPRYFFLLIRKLITFSFAVISYKMQFTFLP